MANKRKKKIHTTLIVDIGTASVSAGIVQSGNKNLSLLRNVERVPVGTGTETARKALVSNVETALKTLFEKYVKESPEQVCVVVAAPWHTARIKTVTSKPEKVGTISRSTIGQALEKFKNEEAPKTGQRDIEAVAVQVAVNGYNTALLKPVLGKDLSINFYESEASLELYTQVIQLTQTTFPNSTVDVHTFPLVAFTALRELSQETCFLVVDVSGEATQVMVGHEDGIHHLSSFPIGYHTLARSIYDKKGELGDALSRLALYARDEFSEQEKQQFKEKFDTVFRKWHEAFNDVLKEAAAHVPVPYMLYLLSDKEPLTWLKKGLQEADTLGFKVEGVNAPMIQNKIELGEKGSYDVFISLSALFLEEGEKEIIQS